MNFFIFILGIVLIYIGFCYLNCPDRISKMNEWIKNNIFSDRLLLTHRRKAGVLLLFVGALILYLLLRG